MKFIFLGNHEQLRSLTSSLGHRVEYMETDGSMLIAHMDSSHPAIVTQVACLPSVLMFPDPQSPVSDAHVQNLKQFGVQKGDTVNVALGKVNAKHPHAIANTDLPIH